MKSTSYKDVVNLKYNLAPYQLDILAFDNKNAYLVKDFLSRDIKKTDNGVEVGSDKYISNSPYYFLRAKSLQANSFLLELIGDSFVPMNPKVFVNYKLEKGDVLISKDSNIGEVVILDKDYPNFMPSGALYKLPLDTDKYYLLAFMKSDIFKDQLDLKVPKGATIRHAGKKFLECKIPYPNKKNKDQIVQYIEVLVKAIIGKEKEIRSKHDRILELIELELKENQIKTSNYIYTLPKISDVRKNNRLNGAFYYADFKEKEYVIKNYYGGYKNIYDLGFEVSRGQNLQVSCIGRSVYSTIPHENFYTLLLPKNLSIYGTVILEEYLGNPKKLKTLKEGDIIFGAEGFEKGRSIVIFKDQRNTITNIHGITLNHKGNDMVLSIFVKCFLDYLRKIGLIDYYAVGGNGGSLAMKYWNDIPFPTLPREKKQEIAQLFYSSPNYPQDLQIDNFLSKDIEWNNIAGIHDLEKSLKILKSRLHDNLQRIANNKEVTPKLNFVHNL